MRHTLEHLGDQLSDKHVRIYADNTTVVACIGKGGLARSKPCQAETDAIWELTERRHIINKVLPGGGKHRGGLGLTSIHQCMRVGTQQGSSRGNIPLPRSSRNRHVRFPRKPKLDRYIMREFDRQAEGMDALSLNWQNVNGFFFPPFSCLARVLHKLEGERPHGVLIAPDWPTQP